MSGNGPENRFFVENLGAGRTRQSAKDLCSLPQVPNGASKGGCQRNRNCGRDYLLNNAGGLEVRKDVVGSWRAVPISDGVKTVIGYNGK